MRVAAEQLAGVVDLGKLAAAIFDLVLARGESAADGDDIDLEAASIVAGDGTVAFGVLVDGGPSGQVETHFAIDLAGGAGPRGIQCRRGEQDGCGEYGNAAHVDSPSC